MMTDKDNLVPLGDVDRTAVSPTKRARPERQSDLSHSIALLGGLDRKFAVGMRTAAMIRKWRKDASMTQSELGRRIGVSQARVSEMESGMSKLGPSFETMERIAEACDITFLWSNMAADDAPMAASAILEPAILEPVGAAASRPLLKEAGVVSKAAGKPLRIRLAAFDDRVLDQAVGEIAAAARRAGGQVRGPIPLPTRIEKFTVNKDPAAGSKRCYEVRSYKRILDIAKPTAATIAALAQININTGVEVELENGVTGTSGGN